MRWKSVTQSQLNCRLGVGLSKQNLDLLVEWGWQYFNEPLSQWKMMVSIHGFDAFDCYTLAKQDFSLRSHDQYFSSLETRGITCSFFIGKWFKNSFLASPCGFIGAEGSFSWAFSISSLPNGVVSIFWVQLVQLGVFFPQRLLKVEEIQILKLFLKFFRQLTLEVVLILGNGNWRPLGPSRLYEI